MTQADQQQEVMNDAGRGIYLALLPVATTILKHIRIVAGVPIGLAIVVTVLSLTVSRPGYVARSSILPQTSQSPASRYASLAAQFGLSAPSIGGGESAAFYEGLLTSRSLLEAVAVSHYTDDETRGGTGREGTLIELLEIPGDDDQEKLRNAFDLLRSRVTTRLEVESSVITLSVRASSPPLAEQVNRRLLDLLAHFNLERRQSQASAERVFTESRMSEAKQQLLASERALQSFLEGNRNYRNSPQLAFEAARLEREVQYQHQLVAALTQAFEQARIEEVRNTPVVTIIDAPEGSAVPASSIARRIAVALLFGTILGGLCAFLIEGSIRWRSSRAPEYDEFLEARRTAAKRLLPGSLIRR